MSLQFIQDGLGNTTGVYIPISDWLKLKSKYKDLQVDEVENNTALSAGQKEILDERLLDYYKSPSEVVSFDATLKHIEKMLL